jgi:hypothetical protein
MAKVNGFHCDNPECDTFETAPLGKHLPDNWLVLTTNPVPPHAAGHFELCSNACVAELSLARLDFDDPDKKTRLAKRVRTPQEPVQPKKAEASNGVVKTDKVGRNYSAEGLAAMRRNGRKLAHKNHHIRNPQSECEFCIEEGLVAPKPKIGDVKAAT